MAGRTKKVKISVYLDPDDMTMLGDYAARRDQSQSMIAEAAVCLLENRSTPGGIWTTAPALGQALIDRLQANAGLTFSVE